MPTGRFRPRSDSKTLNPSPFTLNHKAAASRVFCWMPTGRFLCCVCACVCAFADRQTDRQTHTLKADRQTQTHARSHTHTHTCLCLYAHAHGQEVKKHVQTRTPKTPCPLEGRAIGTWEQSEDDACDEGVALLVGAERCCQF
jgi:hypothetical protein